MKLKRWQDKTNDQNFPQTQPPHPPPHNPKQLKDRRAKSKGTKGALHLKALCSTQYRLQLQQKDIQ